MDNVITPRFFGQQLRSGHWSTDGLVFFWRGIQAGNIVDESLYRNHGTITGATWQGDGLSFNGSSDFATVPQQLLGVKTFTVIAWAMAADTSAGDELILEYTTNANSGGFYIDYRVAQIDYLTQTPIGGALTRWRTSDTLTVGVWTQLAFSVDFNLASGEIVGYINAQLNGSILGDGNNTGSLPNDTLYIGSRAGASLWFGGSIKHISIYNRVLLVNEIQQLFINPDLPMQQEPVWWGQPTGVIVPVMIHHYKQAGGL